ncbi:MULTISPECIES: GlxA family transcriptional regulator [unclassified Novosphingobium]|uniref:GlxA family transcriptional regulator n=1 Tax=unclassified Novosphingobium TaxID=2644732 RepID=UPI00146D399B|nr:MULTISPECIES: GlxA family transcriptional regulator [unclassified Novosphingobium]NMN07586.1 transcriptional regulator GlxA family with amidase domain [Novosphingobium sp. SG919]NMN89889.1 transcriptional regulator GlxA family with amidase domain [Novosphingobium sp. SG916]
MAKKVVVLVIYEGVQALDVAGPLDVFAVANRFLPEEDRYECLLVAGDTTPVRCSNGMWMVADLSFAQAEGLFDTVLVAGGPDLPDSAADEAMSAWLRAWAVQARRYGSICTGAFALGHAGLLDGRTVTTHWLCSAQLATLFPKARVEHDRIHARDDRLVTSAGVTAGIDLSLALVGEDHGPAISLACAKALVVVAQRQGGQSQFSPLLVSTSDPQTPLGKVQAYVMDHVREAFPVERLAELAGVSSRSIARLFVRELDVTPHEFVEGVRLNQARSLLESTDLALKAVAFDCGFASPDQMRSAFQRRLNVTPQQYRASFKNM